MQQRDDRGTIREAVGLFQDEDKLFEAISELEGSGFDRADISLLARDSLFDSALEREYDDTHDAMDSPRAPREPVVTDTDIRQGRTLATGMVGAAAGMGAAGVAILTGGAALAALAAAAAVGIGSGAVVNAIGRQAGQSEEGFLREQIERGGIVIWVRTPDATAEKNARAILSRHCADAVRIHEVSAR